MDGAELLIWRRKHAMTQTQLANYMGIHRNTLVGWETGKHRPPMDLAAKLPVANNIKPRRDLYVCYGMAHTRPDLNLYGSAMSTKGRVYYKAKEHPVYLLELEGDAAKNLPIAILDDPEYLRRLALRRARKWKPGKPLPAP